MPSSSPASCTSHLNTGVLFNLNHKLSLLDKVAASQKDYQSPVKNIIVCTHAKFSTIELCRVLQEIGMNVTFHPVDYSREQNNMDKLLSMGISVVEPADKILSFIQKADCVIEDGARISKLIDQHSVNVGVNFFAVEQTSGGVRYFKEHPPKYPVIDVAMSDLKLDIENRRATPEGVVQYFSEATGKMLGGKRVLILGFGSIGEGLARLCCTYGARVTIYDMLATKRMFAKHRGYETVEKKDFDHILAKQDVVFMATNTYQGTALSNEQLLLMKDDSIICNAGSGRGELGAELQTPGVFDFHDAKAVITEKNNHLEIAFSKGELRKNITILGKAFPINLHLGKGTSHDAIEVVMAMLLLAAMKGPQEKVPGLQALPCDIQECIAEIILEGDTTKQFIPHYVKASTIELMDRPYGGVSAFHNELSRDANLSIVRAWFKTGSKTRGHYHRRSQESYYAEKGAAQIIVWPVGHEDQKVIYPLRTGDYLLVPENYFHDVKVTSKDDFECLVIATPPFQLWDQFFNASEQLAESAVI